MELNQLANIGEFVGGLAVVASLIYVGVQIRQNTESVRATTEFDSSRSYSEWLSQVSLSEDQASIFERGMWEPDSLQGNEKLRFIWAVSDVFSRVEGFYRLHQRGYLPADAFRPWETAVVGYLSSDLVRRWWRAGAAPFSGDFRAYVDGLLQVDATNVSEFTPFAEL